MNDFEWQEKWKTAIVHHAHSFVDLHPVFHRRSIELMGRMTKIMMDNSLHHVFNSEEGCVWIVAIDFIPCEADIKNLEKYAIGIYELTGIDWTRVAHEGTGWDIRITGESITSKLGD